MAKINFAKFLSALSNVFINKFTTESMNAQGLPRLFEADIVHEEYAGKFNARDVKTQVVITAYGHSFIKGTDWVSLGSGNEGIEAAGNHLRSIAKNHKELEHNNEQLQKHIEVIHFIC